MVRLCSFLALTLCCLATAAPRYDIGTPRQTLVWVDPANGDDAHTGATREQALRSLRTAWNRIPQGSPLTSGYRILLAPGTYTEELTPTYWEDRQGTFEAPISIEGSGDAVLSNINIFGCRYLYFIGITVRVAGGDGLHCEQCDHLLIRDARIEGLGNIRQDEGPQETLKLNQSTHVYIENSDISGAWDNAVDAVGVQHGHMVGNRIHRANDWCAYVKGGSAYWIIENNEFYDCGTGGFTAGQGTGYEFMSAPWIQYEAYDIRVVNNFIHDTEGAGLGVNGGYNILMAYNTLLRVGQRSHALEVVFGLRTCDGDPDRCAALRAMGGWGPVAVVDAEDPIPNRSVYIFHNLIVSATPDQHFAIYGPRTPGDGSGIPSPARTDDNLIIRGNWIWNGPANHPLGIEDDDAGCQPSNPTCTLTQLRAENSINQMEPRLDMVTGRFLSGATLPMNVGLFALPVFTNEGRPAGVPTDLLLSTVVHEDRDGNPQGPRAGAYLLSKP